jgi:hypothetical protein
MRFIDSLCPPALLYLLFVTIQVALDLSLGLLGVAAIKAGVGIAVTYILNTLCSVQLGVVSWAIVATPFLITAAGAAIAIGLESNRQIATEKFALSPQTSTSADDVVVTLSQEASADDYPFSTNSAF